MEILALSSFIKLPLNVRNKIQLLDDIQTWMRSVKTETIEALMIGTLCPAHFNNLFIYEWLQIISKQMSIKPLKKLDRTRFQFVELEPSSSNAKYK